MALGFLRQGAAAAQSAATLSDEALLQAFAQGQARAFEQLYARHHQALYRFVRRLLAQAAADAAEEVIQDAWMKLVEQAPRWQPQGATVRTWLFTMAHHRAVDVLRRSGREVSLGPGDEAEPEGAEPFEPTHTAWADWPAADAVFWRDAGQRLLQCLEHLPGAQKAAFLLHHDEGLSIDQVARVVGAGVETAKTRFVMR
jgi:RNA polymerase sigma factor (sigma-70 family)